MPNHFARHLRKNMTDAERFVWQRIRYRQLGGFRFRRQAPIGPFIADFVCFEARFILELDGGQHATQVEADAARTRWLEGQGFRVMRVWNNEVFEDWDSVAEGIVTALTVPLTPHPNPPPQGGREPEGGPERTAPPAPS